MENSNLSICSLNAILLKNSNHKYYLISEDYINKTFENIP